MDHCSAKHSQSLHSRSGPAQTGGHLPSATSSHLALNRLRNNPEINGNNMAAYLAMSPVELAMMCQNNQQHLRMFANAHQHYKQQMSAAFRAASATTSAASRPASTPVTSTVTQPTGTPMAVDSDGSPTDSPSDFSYSTNSSGSPALSSNNMLTSSPVEESNDQDQQSSSRPPQTTCTETVEMSMTRFKVPINQPPATTVPNLANRPRSSSVGKKPVARNLLHSMISPTSMSAPAINNNNDKFIPSLSVETSSADFTTESSPTTTPGLLAIQQQLASATLNSPSLVPSPLMATNNPLAMATGIDASTVLANQMAAAAYLAQQQSLMLPTGVQPYSMSPYLSDVVGKYDTMLRYCNTVKPVYFLID